MDISLEGLTLHVADVEKSLEFYSRIPGVVVAHHRPGQFAMLRIGNGRLGLLRHGTAPFHVELEVADLDGAYEELTKAGIKAQSPPADRPWGERDFLVLDPDGHMLEFGQAHQRSATGE